MLDMSFELPTFEQKKSLHSLLLTMEQEVEARKGDADEWGESRPYFERKFQQGDRNIRLLGTKHSPNLIDIEKDVAVYRETDPEILLHEGNDIRVVFQNVFPGMTEDEIRELDPVVIAKNQEQIFLAWQAWKDGKTVQSWDIPFSEQVKMVAHRHTPEAIAGFVVSIALSKLYQDNIQPSQESMEDLLPRVLSQKDRDDLASAGIDLSFASLERAAQKYLKTSFTSLAERFSDEKLRKEDNGFFHRYFDPAYPGETNAVLKDMNVIRDQHAIDVMEEAKSKYKNVLAVAGGSHVRTWGPAVAELYKDQDRQMSEGSGAVFEALEDNPKKIAERENRHEKDQVSAQEIADRLKTS